ncbi:hypothetical protein KAW50_03580 [candidate division WOR-3 bacterium]|nr:hypothetical protein [candidate division WOR-3 bacterium]
MKKKKKIKKCLNCGAKLIEAKDSIAKKYTGYLWRCPKCTPKNKVICIG